MFFRPQTWINIVACGLGIYAILTLFTLLSIQRKFMFQPTLSRTSGSGACVWFCALYVTVIGSLNGYFLIDYLIRFRRRRRLGYCSHCGELLPFGSPRCVRCGTSDHKRQARGFRVMTR